MRTATTHGWSRQREQHHARELINYYARGERASEEREEERHAEDEMRERVRANDERASYTRANELRERGASEERDES